MGAVKSKYVDIAISLAWTSLSYVTIATLNQDDKMERVWLARLQARGSHLTL